MTGQILFLLALRPAIASGVDFDGTDDYVGMGVATSVGLQVFTVECWFRWDGEGLTTSSGSSGLSAWPLVAHGRGESDGGTQDANWFLGIDEATGTLAADFEDMEAGDNHPAWGVTDVRDGLWHHAAMVFDGVEWSIYLDAVLDGSALIKAGTPRYDTIQHLGVGSALGSDGAPDGAFRGAIDEVRVWSLALAPEEIRAIVNEELPGADGLVARWGMDEGVGVVANDSVGDLDGTLMGATWSGGAPFDVNAAPDEPLLLQPADDAENLLLDVHLSAGVSDFEDDPLVVTFEGRIASVDHEPFTLAVIPDSQWYCSESYDGLPEMFDAQTAWMVSERERRNIVYVAHVGDIVNDGDEDPGQWDVADAAMSLLEDPVTTGLPDGIPFGVAVGNHEQTPNGDPSGTTTYFNATFGLDRFEGRPWYLEAFGKDNDSHADVFTAGGMDFLVIYMEYDVDGDPDVIAWAADLVATHPDHRVILVSHHLLETDGSLSAQGQAAWDAMSGYPNLFLTLCGHLDGEVLRTDVGAGTVYSMMADYQFDGYGGAGYLRVLSFSPPDDRIHVQTWSPWLGESRFESISDFYLDYEMPDDVPWTVIGSAGAVSGQEVEAEWSGLAPFTTYEWRVRVWDGRSTTSTVRTFTTGSGEVEKPDETGLEDTGGDSAETAMEKDTSDTPGYDTATPPPHHVIDEKQGNCGCGTRGQGSWGFWLLGILTLGRSRRRR